MKRLPSGISRFLQLLTVAGIAVGVYLLLRTVIGGPPTVHALPEFTTRTGEPCVACHVNPGGGGPRTLPGLLWAAQGRPDEVPTFPGLLLAPGVTRGIELYDIGCAGCHGYSGEGLFGNDLAGSGITKAQARSFIVRGIPELEMPSFAGQYTDEQLDTLSEFVASLGRGEVPPEAFLLPRARFGCEPLPEINICGGE